MPEDYINDQGLFIGLTYAHNPAASYGLTPSHIMRLIAEKCTTVSQALKIFQKVPVCYAKNFFIADKHGAMAVVEHAAAHQYQVLQPNANVLIHTNHYLAPRLVSHDQVLIEHPTHTTYLRYYEALRGINRCLERDGQFTRSDAMAILRQSNYVYTQDLPRFATIWSLALDLGDACYDLRFDTLTGEKSVRLEV